MSQACYPIPTQLLPFDVLHHIMSMCHRNEVKRMRQVCSVLATNGGKLLLSSETVSLGSRDTMRSFNEFILADADRRLSTAFSVLIAIQGYCPRTVAILKDTLETYGSKIRLKSLQIASLEDLLGSDPGIPAAFARIALIEKLHIYQAGPRTRTLLRALSGDVRSVRIDSVPGYYSDHVNSQPYINDKKSRNIIDLMCSMRGSVTTISGEGYDTSLEGAGFKDESAIWSGRYDLGRIVHSNVRKLDISSVVPLHVALYARALPNLTHLGLRFARGYPCDNRYAAQWRVDNMASQARNGSWPKLECFRGDLDALWLLGLACQVESVELLGGSQWDTKRFLRVLRDVRPKRLKICPPRNVLGDHHFRSALRQDGSQELRVLCLSMSFPSHVDLKRCRHAMDVLAKFIRSAPLIALDMVICCECDFSLHDDPDPTFVEPLANQLQEKIPSLSSLRIEVNWGGVGQQVVVVQRGPEIPDAPWSA